MRVICIDASPEMHPSAIRGASGFWIKEGSVYTVAFEGVCYGELLYALEEDPDNNISYEYYYGFRASRFIPLSTVDETVLAEQRQTETV